jgi:hypothetical protein
MQTEAQNLGKIQSVHGLSGAYSQRLVIVAGLALLFFSAMLIAFAVRQWFGYALLAVGFLVVEILTMIGWFSHRGADFAIYEDGFIYKNHVCRWEDIHSIYSTTESGLFGRRLKCEIKLYGGETIQVPDTIQHLDDVIKTVGKKMKIEA